MLRTVQGLVLEDHDREQAPSSHRHQSPPVGMWFGRNALGGIAWESGLLLNQSSETTL